MRLSSARPSHRGGSSREIFLIQESPSAIQSFSPSNNPIRTKPEGSDSLWEHIPVGDRAGPERDYMPEWLPTQGSVAHPISHSLRSADKSFFPPVDNLGAR